MGGRVTSTLLTLLVLPAVYRWFVRPGGRRVAPLGESAGHPAE